MAKKSENKKKALELTDKKRIFNETRDGKDLVQGKSIEELKRKYLGTDSADRTATELKKKKSSKVEVKLTKKRGTGEDSDYTVQERTIILKDGKMEGSQG